MTEPRFPQLDRIARDTPRVRTIRRGQSNLVRDEYHFFADPDRFLLDECVDDVLEGIEARDSGKR